MKKKWIIALVFILLLLLIFVFYLLFGRQKTFTIAFDTNGGTEVASIEVKNNEAIKLPEAPTKEGYKFVGWMNEDGYVITKGLKATQNMTLKAEWISNDAETITAKFNTDGGNEIDNILIEKGKIILLPIEPTKEGYVFVCWVDSNENFITENMKVTNNITLKAIWRKKGTKTVTIKFDTDGGTNIESIAIEKGTRILLPKSPTKEGYKFAGWFLENGSEVTKDFIVDKDITVKATWKEPYTCPKDCTPIGNGSKCTKTTTKDLIIYKGCPNGTETIERFCSEHKRQVSVGFDEDQTFVDAGILCNGNPKNFCVDYSSRYTHNDSSCPSGYFKYTYSESGLDAMTGCVKKYDKGGSNCPSGYKRSGNVCKKTETIACKAN